VARSHTITGWNPEDRAAWQAGGEAIARRNLLWSVAAEHVGFSVWSLLHRGQLVLSPRQRSL
jgi:NNP family nitrate/nitrite transporter-like MFS transporter